MIGFLGQVILPTHHFFRNPSAANSTRGATSTISPALIAKSSPIFPNRFALPSTKTYPQRSNAPPAQSYNLQTLSPAHKMMPTPRRLPPPHRPPPHRPQYNH